MHLHEPNLQAGNVETGISIILTQVSIRCWIAEEMSGVKDKNEVGADTAVEVCVVMKR